ncbi:MAG: DinB family protein [Caldilineaceae bacterium]|jgi:uncharacterized damage-inducible protein DinB|nr:DinB family protein [Caldilineaceae bacterium]
MNLADLMTLYNYNYWANRRILQAADGLTVEQFVAPHDLSWGSIRDVLVHTLGAEWIWRIRCQEGRSPSAMLNPAQFPTLDALTAQWAEEESAMRGYLASLEEAALSQPLAYVSTGGRPFSSTLWHILVHVVNHGTQHRAEVAHILTQLDHSPGDLDMILYAREAGVVE